MPSDNVLKVDRGNTREYSKELRVRMMRQRLLAWYKRVGRSLPWRQTRDPYAILVSEVMLQQTQVDRVRPKYLAWIDRWPTVQKLAHAPAGDILRLWSGLGYNRRALFLKRSARVVTETYGGQFPDDPALLQLLPGLGPYTARAVAVFAFRKPIAMIDTNIRRVLSRVFFWPNIQTEKKLQALADEIVPPAASDTWHHALMDLGATICISGRPRCEICPIKQYCRAYPTILTQPKVQAIKPSLPFRDSNRFWRGRIVAAVASARFISTHNLFNKLQSDGTLPLPRMQEILLGLVSDGLIEAYRSGWRIPE